MSFQSLEETMSGELRDARGWLHLRRPSVDRGLGDRTGQGKGFGRCPGMNGEQEALMCPGAW